MKCRWLWHNILFGVLLVLAGSAGASIIDPFSGLVDISGIRAEVDGLDRETIRQEYNVSFMHGFTPWLDVRAAFRYYKFDENLELVLGAYREEIQPSAEIRWNHPLFLLSTSAFGRKVVTPIQGGIITQDFQASFKTKDISYPLFELRYDRQHTYYEERPDVSDIRNARLMAIADYQMRHHQFHYSFNHTQTENVVSDLETDLFRHLLRWLGHGTVGADRRLQLNGNYSFSHATQVSEVTGSGLILDFLPLVMGLYAFDESPISGTLEPRAGLVDGNTSTPVAPLIDIGGAATDHNIGVDLGNPRDAAAIYIYTDRPSSPLVRWDVWGSDDNLTWQPVDASPDQAFNSALNRYELVFTPTFYRYLKTVNSGLNQIAQVYITEIEVLRQLTDKDEDRRIAAAHQFDGRAGYVLGDHWHTSLDLSLAYEEVAGSSQDRDNEALGWRLVYDPSETITHNLRATVSRQNDARGSGTLVDNVLGYSLLADPLETLRGSLSVSNRISWLGSERSNNILSGAVEGDATVVEDLTFLLGFNASLGDDYLSDRGFRTWMARTGLEAGIVSYLDLTVDYSYQETVEDVFDELTVRQSVSLGLDWRLTRTIYLRGAWRFTRDQTARFLQDYLVSWNILPSLSITAQHYEIGTDDVTTTLRQGVNINWELTRRSNVYLRLAKVDLTGGRGSRTDSVQLGLRFTF